MKRVQRIAEALDRLEEKTAKIEYEKSLTYQDHVEFQVYFLCGDDPMLAPIGQQLRAVMAESVLLPPTIEDPSPQDLCEYRIFRDPKAKAIADMMFGSFFYFDRLKFQEKEQEEQATKGMKQVVQVYMDYPKEATTAVCGNECLKCGFMVPIRRQDRPLAFHHLFENCPLCGGKQGRAIHTMKEIQHTGPWWLPHWMEWEKKWKMEADERR